MLVSLLSERCVGILLRSSPKKGRATRWNRDEKLSPTCDCVVNSFAREIHQKPTDLETLIPECDVSLQSSHNVYHARPLLVGLPVRFLERDLVVLRGGLDPSFFVDCARNHRVFSRFNGA